ncbi:MAG: Pr6Pr family membrane protein [Gemmobacter sp.]
MRARYLAAAAALVAAVSLTMQAIVTLHVPGMAGVGAAAWAMAGYFTILTNVGVALVLGASVLRRTAPRAPVALALTVAILMVGLIYHLLLARLWSPACLAWWADQGLHTVVPLLTLAWWLRGAERAGWADLPAVLVWPLVYGAYALTRGASTGWFPYPFIDAGALGWGRVAVNIAGMSAGFVLLGTLLLLMAPRRS